MKGAVKKFAIIAGSGSLPVKIFEDLTAKGDTPLLLLVKGNIEPYLEQFSHEIIDVGDFSKLLKTLKRYKITDIILAGGIQARPELRSLRFPFSALLALPAIVFALRKGDDFLLRSFIQLIESYGYKVIAGQNLAPKLLAPKASLLTKSSPSKLEQQNISLAFEAAKLLGKLDIGQGAIAVNGRVVAVEGAEGTDLLLERLKTMRAISKIPSSGGVLVKCAKPEQDLRADLPTIGLETIKNAHLAGLKGLAVEANSAFMLDLQEMIDYANQHGMFIQTVNYSHIKLHETL